MPRVVDIALRGPLLDAFRCKQGHGELISQQVGAPETRDLQEADDS